MSVLSLIVDKYQVMMFVRRAGKERDFLIALKTTFNWKGHGIAMKISRRLGGIWIQELGEGETLKRSELVGAEALIHQYPQCTVGIQHFVPVIMSNNLLIVSCV